MMTITNLMHGERVDLSLQNSHSVLVDNSSYIRHHGITEDVIDEVVIALKPCRCYMLHGETVIHL